MAKFEINNVKVYGLDESILAARYPMLIAPGYLDYKDEEDKEKRVIKAVQLSLTANKEHLPHDCWMKGVTVQMDVTFPHDWALQESRYHFIDIVSSTSKMHMLFKAPIGQMCDDHVDERIIAVCEELQQKYNEEKNEENYLRLLRSLPIGYMLTARFTTNYLQLKNIYNQRRAHKLPEWRKFCSWILTLPLMSEAMGKSDIEDIDMEWA